MTLQELYEKYTETINIAPALNQQPEVIQMLKSQSTYYHATNKDYSVGDVLPVNKYITYSLNYAKTLGYKYIYVVSLPNSFVHTKYVGNKWAQYHIINKGSSKILKKELIRK